MVVKVTYVVWEFHWKSIIFWKLIFGLWMAILTILWVWILKFIIQGFQNQTSYLWIITMTSSIYPFMKACQKWIWHTIFCALIWFLLPFEIRQLKVQSKVCEWFPFTEPYPKSGNFHEVQKSLFDTPFHQIWLEILTDGLRWLILLFLSGVNILYQNFGW